jgi:AraC-like DNA-binding protein
MSAPSRFESYKPAPPLSRFIAVFWYWQGRSSHGGGERVLPTGTTELVIDLSARKTSSGVLSGPHSKPFFIDPSDSECVIGVHFHPGGSHPFLKNPCEELTNLHVSLDDIWSRDIKHVREALFEAPTIHEKFQLLERWLLSRLNKPLVRHRAVELGLEKLKSNADVFISDLADAANLSQRRFIEVFRKEVGLTPKGFQRLIRFQRVLTKVQHLRAPDWSEIALDSGYFDQAHFNRDFKEFSGLTPSQYLKLRTEHLNHVRS